MQYLGYILVILAFLSTGCAALFAATTRPRMVRAAAALVVASTWFHVSASLILVYSLLSHDFSNRYVAAYSASWMSSFYILTAFWAGEKGALLFWALLLSILAAILVRKRKGDESRFLGVMIAVISVALLFFDTLMVFASNPFETFMEYEAPVEGSGLNPLLLNPLMAVHPPVQLAGFVAYTIPFAFAWAAMITGQQDSTWIHGARSWYLFAWTLLTAGLVLGGLWAYLELGWGGFWGWDPVENAALLPWLTGTAMLHSLAVERKTGALRRWNMTLVSLTFVLTIFATFLTRSRLVHSLHAFAESALTPYFILYLSLLTIGSITLLAYRWRDLRGVPIQTWSREFLVVANNGVFILLLFVVLWGTLLPTISEFVMRFLHLSGIGPVEVGPEWFNNVVPPIGLLILALAAIGPAVPLRRARSKAVVRLLAKATACALVAGLLFNYFFGEYDLSGYHLLATAVFILAFMVVWVAAMDIRGAVRVRCEVTGEGVCSAIFGLFRANPARFGGHAVHVGVAFVFIAFAGNAGKIEVKDVILEPLGRISVAGQNLVYTGTQHEFLPEKNYVSAKASVLLWPDDDKVPLDAIEALQNSIHGVRSIEVVAPPEVNLIFEDPSTARSLYTAAFVRTVVSNDYEVLKVDSSWQEVHLRPKQLLTARIAAHTFHRLIATLRRFADALGSNRVSVHAKRGDPVVSLRFIDSSLFGTFVQGITEKGAYPFVTARLDSATGSVAVIPSGVGKMLFPETRYYLHFSNPTTEVDIKSGLFRDLYVAASFDDRSDAISLTVIINPLMWFLWIGATLSVIFGFVTAFSPKLRRSTRW